jgi:hypothetical protein
MAAFRTGIARMTRMDVTKVIHTKSGKRPMVRPGARSVRIVAMRFIAVETEPTPRTSSARIQ